MKKALKVTFGTMLAASMVAPAYATGNDFLNHSAVYVEGTYYRPSNNGLSVGDQLVAPSITAGQFGAPILDGWRRADFLNPENTYDYALGYSYHIPRSPTRVFLRYEHFDDDTAIGGVDAVDFRNIGTEPGYPNYPNVGPVGGTMENAKLHESLSEFKVGLSRELQFTPKFGVELLGFLENDRLSVSLSESMFGTIYTSTVPQDLSRDTDGKMTGFGPGIGAVGKIYPFSRCPQWAFFAGGTTTLLYANNEYQQSYYQTQAGVSGGGVVNPVFYVYDPEDSHSLVGKVDISFGVNYHYRFMHDVYGAVFDLTLGLRYMNIINAMKNGDTAYNPFIANFAANTGWPQDWGLFGPFLRFRLGGRDA